jgi:hypothetical protein
MAFYSMDFGNFTLNAVKDSSGNYNISYKYGSNNEARIEIKNDNILDLKLFIRKRHSGGIYIDKNLGIIKSNIIDIKVIDFPLNPFYKDKPQGSVGISGYIDKETGGSIHFRLSGFKTDSIAQLNALGSLTMKDGEYILTSSDDGDFISLNAAIKDFNILSADFTFHRIRLSNVVRALGYDRNSFSGFTNGAINYKRDKSLDFDIQISSGVFYYNNRFSEWIMKGSASAAKIELQRFSLKNLKQENIADISGLIDWTSIGAKSNIKSKIDKLQIKDFVFSSDINFNGILYSENQIKGDLKNSSIQINGLLFPSLKSDMTISKKRIALDDIESDNGLKGEIKYDFENDFISAYLQFKNTNISNIVNGLSSGLLIANAEILGERQNLKISASGSLRKGTYMKSPISIDFKTSFAKNEMTLDKLNVISNNAKLAANGKYSKMDNIEFSYENITKDLAEKFFKIKVPIQGGKFSGGGKLYNTYNGDSIKMIVKGSDTVVSNIKIDNFTSDININQNIISIGSVSVKMANAQIKLQNAQYNFKSGDYSLDLELINTNFGFLNIFGKTVISGNIDKDMYLGTIRLNDFWINKYKISSFDMRYKVEGSSITLVSDESKTKVDFDASALFDLKSRLVIKSFNLSYLNTIISADAVFDRNDFRANVKGSNIDIDIIGDILNSPIDILGNGNLLFQSSGTFKNPSINLSLNVYNGSIARVPFDYANFVVDIHQNLASIKAARVVKRNEMDLSISGEFPFWLDDSVKEVMMKKAVNIKYDFSDSKLAVLKYLSDGFVESKSGRVSLNGNIRGSLNEMSNSGRLIISGGSLKFQDYLSNMKDVNIDIELKDNDLKINQFSAKSSAGTLIITGGVDFDSFEIKELNLRARTQNGGIPISISQLSIPSTIISDIVLKDVSKAEPTFDISITGHADSPKISGNIILEKSRFNYPPPNNNFSSDFSFIPPNAQFEIDLLTGKDTNFENAIVNARINGAVKFRGTYSNIQVQGDINTQRGTLTYLGAAFNIIDGRVEIIDKTVYISGEGKTEVSADGGKSSDEVTLTIIRSDTEHLNLKFTSRDNPSMDSRTIIAKVLGIKIEDTSIKNEDNSKKPSNPEDTNWTGLTNFEIQQQAVRLINSNFVVPLARTLLRRTGIVDNLKVSYVETSASNALSGEISGANSDGGSAVNPESNDPALAAAAADANSYTLANFLYGTKYTIEKNLTNQVALGYSLLFDQLNNQLDLRHGLELTYRLTNNLSLTGNYEMQSENLMRQPDRRIMIRHQVKFGGGGASKQSSDTIKN